MPQAELERALSDVARLFERGEVEAAFTLATDVVTRFPQSSAAHTNLGFFLIKRRELEQAQRAYVRALTLDAANVEARRGLAVACAQLGIDLPAASALSRVPAEADAGIELLVLVTLGTGNVVIERLFDPQHFAVTKLAVELFDRVAELPAHDAIFNAIGEADAARDALDLASDLLARPHGPLLNGPAAIKETGRARVAERLAGIDGLRMPRVELVTRNVLSARTLQYPLLLRSPGYHTGEHFVRVEQTGDLAGALDALPGDELLAIENVDVRDAGGLYAKYRAMAIGDEVLPLHAAFSTNWKVHYFSANMEDRADLRAREAEFLRDMRSVTGDSGYAALRTAARRLGLDYMGIDFGIDSRGRIVIFEANATMAVRSNTPAAERIIARLRTLIESKVHR